MLNFNLKVIVALAFFGFLTPIVLSANEGVQHYDQLLKAEENLLKAELAVENEKLNRLNRLLANGHATWLETRQQKLDFDILSAKLKFFAEYRTTTPQSEIRELMPWLSSTAANQATLQELKQQLTEAQQTAQKLNVAIHSPHSNDRQRRSYRLRHSVAVSQAQVLHAKIEMLQQPSEQPATTQSAEFQFASLQDHRPVTPAVQAMLLEQAELQVELTQQYLNRERQRLKSFTELSQLGVVNQRSVDQMHDKIDSLEQLVEQQQSEFEWLQQTEQTGAQFTSLSPGELESPELTTELVTELAAGGSAAWLDVAKQFQVGEANFWRQIATLKKEMSLEVLARLQKAAQQNTSSLQTSRGNLETTLIRGQQRELEQYRWKIHLAELQEALLTSQINLLNASELPSGEFFVLASSPGRFAGQQFLASRFRDYNPIYQPISLSSYVYQRRGIPSSTLPKSTLPSGAFSISPAAKASVRYGSLSLSDSRLQGQSAHRSFRRVDRAYPFGILRSELRSFTTPGQPPWLLPGSATNLRSSQLRTNVRRDSFGRTGNQLLKTTRYSDLYGQ